MRAPRITLMAASLVAIVACADAVPSGLDASTTPLLSKTSVTEPVSGPWARIVEGKTGPGSLYAIYVPRNPNGDAVFYAHGIRDAFTYLDPGVAVPTEVTLNDQDRFFALRDMLGAAGYTVAYSSFSENGFAVKDGAQRTHQLRGLVASEMQGQPARSFLVGHSLGGAIGLDLVERYPGQYDGALLMCGMVGGSQVETQYVGHVRALFDAFYPNSNLGGSLLVSPRRVFTPAEIGAIVATNPAGLLAIASTAQTALPFIPVGSLTDPMSPISQTLVGSLFGALAFHARGVENILDLTKDESPFDNATTTYVPGTPARPLLPPEALAALLAGANSSVERVGIGPLAQKYLDKYFTPTGDLRVPVLTLHNTWDPGVPEFHEESLKTAVAQAGALDKLLQRRENSFGHCNIAPDKAMQSFTDLASWVSTGVKPAM
jgi:predicted esterase